MKARSSPRPTRNGQDASTARPGCGVGSKAEGGRVGYSNGGLSKYEIFKLGELGYNTKGGTVLEPFGGIKVLRDIFGISGIVQRYELIFKTLLTNDTKKDDGKKMV